MRGSSGAFIGRAMSGHVTKLDTQQTGNRVMEQGRWLLTTQLEHPEWRSLPRHTAIIPTGYTMEYLVDWERSAFVADDIGAMATVLAREIWSAPAVVKFEEAAHVKWLSQLLRDTGQSDIAARTIVPEIGELYACLTHGDPILDNVMRRANDELVLIDPIPATPAVPDVLASDVGRLVQSGVGYENARYGFTGKTTTPLQVATLAYAKLDMLLSQREYTAVVYFATLHMLRGVRTAMRVAPERVGALNALVDELVEEWWRAWTQ